MSNYTIRFTLFCAIIVGCCLGCKFGGGSASGDDAGILRIGELSNPSHLDPALLQDVDTTAEMEQVFEGLLKYNADLKIVPSLAESWDVKNGGKTYIFHLRKNVKFSNGDQFSARDVKFSIERACNPAVMSTVADQYMGDIVGVDDACKGKTKEVSGVKVIDDQTLEIDIKNPLPYFLGKLVYNTSWVLDHRIVPFDKPILSSDLMIGTGPFKVTKYIEDLELNMAPNDYYWGGKTDVKGIRFVIQKEPITRLNLFKSNKLDILLVSPSEARDLKGSEYEKDIQLFPRVAIEYFAMNEMDYAPFGNVHVRKAFAMAIDNNEIINKIGGGIFKVATGILPPGIPGRRDKADVLAFESAEAKKELALGGYTDGSKLPDLKIYSVAGDLQSQRDSEAIQNQLKQNLGVNCIVVPLDISTLIDKETKNLLPAYLLSWYADYPDAQDFLSLMLTTHGLENHTFYSNPKVDQLCAEADVLVGDDQKRANLYAQAEDIVLQEAAWRPIGFNQVPTLINPRVSGLQQSIYSFGLLNTIKLK